MVQDWTWIDSPNKMQRAQDDLLRAEKIGVDTEYDSFRYFREKLCLVQIRTGDATYLFDPLSSFDFTFLGEVFNNPHILKILHAGDNDIRILRRDYDFEFQNIFDTSRAASILGCQYLSLAVLIRQYLGVEFEKLKRLQRSQWENRPLTEEQVTYAVRDTSYLMPLYEVLQKELRERGVIEDAERAFQDISQVVWQEKIFDSRAHLRNPGYGDLTPEEQRTLKRLYRWRFNKATETNRAAFMILADKDLLSLAKIHADSSLSLITEGGLSHDKVNRYGHELLKIIFCGEQMRAHECLQKQ
ncbi:MAG: ribonuclease D [Syntrophales bacterium]|nr:ribonuclease D [Syntrophales bacterium]